jgi:excisionase family DNA binding protein
MRRDAVHPRLGHEHARLGLVSDLRPSGFYVLGIAGPSVEVPGRICAWLEAHLDLRRVRTDVRGIDPEVDSVLNDLALAALTWRSRFEASRECKPSQPVALLPWLTVSEAADQLGVTGSRVRQLVHTNALAAEQVDRRWRINRLNFEHYKAARAA